MVKNKKSIAYDMKIVFNLKKILKTSIKSDVITSKVASLVRGLEQCCHSVMKKNHRIYLEKKQKIIKTPDIQNV